MITLPNIVTSGIATGRTGEAETTATGESAPGIQGLPQDFLAELGQQLLTLAQQQQGPSQGAEKDVESDSKVSPAEALGALLASLENPDALNTLLSPEKIKAAVKSADDKENSDTLTLSATDQQNLEALFAMLPAAAPLAQTPDSLKSAGSRLSETQHALLTTANGQRPAPDETTGEVITQAISATFSGKQMQESSRNTATAQQSLVPAPVALENSVRQSAASQDEQSAVVEAPAGHHLAPVSASAIGAPVMASASISSPSTAMLNAQLGSSEWQQALSQQIVMFTRNGQQNAELHLHPADLGAIQISLKLDNDQAQLHMVSSHSHVRAALEAALPQLRNALAESGIQLGESNVSSDAFAQGQGSQGQQEARRDNQQGRFSLAVESDSDITPLAVPASLQARVTGNGAVDTFA